MALNSIQLPYLLQCCKLILDNVLRRFCRFQRSSTASQATLCWERAVTAMPPKLGPCFGEKSPGFADSPLFCGRPLLQGVRLAESGQ